MVKDYSYNFMPPVVRHIASQNTRRTRSTRSRGLMEDWSVLRIIQVYRSIAVTLAAMDQQDLQEKRVIKTPVLVDGFEAKLRNAGKEDV